MTARAIFRGPPARLPLLLAAAAVLSLAVLALLVGAEAALAGYLWAWLFWLGPAAGSLALVMVHPLTGGRWGESMAPALVPAAMAVPLLALLFLPVLLGAHLVYPWAGHPEAVASPDVARLYLNVPAFLVRAVLTLGIWSALAVVFAWRGGTSRLAAALGLVLYAVTATFAAIDWAMSLDPRWSSTVFGATFAVGQILAALAWAAVLLADRAPSGAVADHAALLLAALLGFLYLEFMQYLVIWSGNLPDKAAWYVLRGIGAWNLVLAFAAVAGGLAPFCLLLVTRVRHDPRGLALAGGLVLLGLLAFWLWQMAGLHPGHVVGLADVVAPAALAALWVAWLAAPASRPRGGERQAS